MTELKIRLDDSDFDRLFVIKTIWQMDNLTGEQFATELIKTQLRGLFPAVPRYDEAGNLTNADSYMGKSGQ